MQSGPQTVVHMALKKIYHVSGTACDKWLYCINPRSNIRGEIKHFLSFMSIELTDLTSVVIEYDNIYWVI